MKIQRIDHVGVIVNDLAAAKAFFLALELEVQGEEEVAGTWVDRVIGLDGVKNTVVFLRVPGGETGIELIKFSTPVDERGVQPSFANTLGIRHVAFAVEDIDAIVADLRARGAELVGELERVYDQEGRLVPLVEETADLLGERERQLGEREWRIAILEAELRRLRGADPA